MWWYNILGNNKGSISDILQLNHITAGYVLLATNIVAPKQVNPETILTVKELNGGNSLIILV